MKVHMIGIGGIGISSLAQLYMHQGHTVSGTNDGPSPQTLDRLRARGVPISLDISVEALPHDADLFVYSDAWLSREPAFMDAVRALGTPMRSYFEALGDATREGTSIVVSGTNGKTTTTAMLAKILIDAGVEPTVIAGSVLTEHGSNFVAGRPDLFVVEGCEYRRHFLSLHPHILVITNVELDHTDYYRDLADVQSAFIEAVRMLPPQGTLVTDTEAPAIEPVRAAVTANVVAYQRVAVPALRTPGAFNVANAQAAKAAARAFLPSLADNAIDVSLADFRGTWRRFEYKGVTASGAVVYDDYAHHPTAVRGTLEAVRTAFPGKRLVVVFHPHLYSRTKRFFREFAQALARADRALVLPIYAAREQPDRAVSGDSLAAAVTAEGGDGRYVGTFDAAARELAGLGDDTIIITMGAGDVYLLADRITGTEAVPLTPREVPVEVVDR